MHWFEEPAVCVYLGIACLSAYVFFLPTWQPYRFSSKIRAKAPRMRNENKKAINLTIPYTLQRG